MKYCGKRLTAYRREHILHHFPFDLVTIELLVLKKINWEIKRRKAKPLPAIITQMH